MDVFKLLSRGANIKRENRGNNDKKDKNLELEVEKDVDFFKSKSAKKNPNIKKRRNSDVEVGEKEEEEKKHEPLVISSDEQANQQRKQSRTKVTGEDVPLPIGSFNDLKQRFNIHPHLLRNLERAKFDTPTPIQAEAIPVMLRERDLIACAPTGSGKTLGYVLPIVQALKQHSTDGIRCLIISPTKELATQIYNETIKLSKGRDLNVCILNKAAAARFVKQKDAASKQKFDVLIATPRRLVDTLSEIDLSRVQYIIFDEADKLFEGEKEMNKAEKKWQHLKELGEEDEFDENVQLRTFAAQSDLILSACTNVKLRKAMFSATIPSGVEAMANSIMVDPVRVIVGRKEAASDDVEQKVVFTGNEEGKLLEIKQMITNGEFKPPVLIFVQSIQRAKALYHELIYDSINVDAIHGEKTSTQRNRVIERFKQGDIWVLICTDVLARGIDFQGVNLVINYDIPQTSQAYVHRVGRTGRAGKKGKAVTFFTKDDSVAVKNVINVIQQSGQHVDEWMNNMTRINTKQKQQLRKTPIDRKEISTVPHLETKMQKYQDQKHKKKQEMIEGSKRRKLHNNNNKK